MNSAPLFLDRYMEVRERSIRLCAPLTAEDHVPQPMPETSPPKWHLGHTTWYFETMLLVPNLLDYKVYHPRFTFLFNSYYESLGPRVARVQRGHLSRPTVNEVLAYRAHVDNAIERLLQDELEPRQRELLELGLQHEQQHQELLLTDIKVILGCNPLDPAYDPDARSGINLDAEHLDAKLGQDQWVESLPGVVEVGHDGSDFAFDNESPRHKIYVRPVRLRRTLITNSEYLNFMADGGYQRHELWHAEGWDWLAAQPQRAPLHWRADPARPGHWLHFTLQGLQPLGSHAPITHVSYYEAFAFCQWAGWRLPTEFEWEALAPALDWGQRWEWTQSAYEPYPGFRRSPDAAGEYNGKFMVNQQVLRGASFATPPGHARRTYRNFFHAHERWQYTGIRPARDVDTQGQS